MAHEEQEAEPQSRPELERALVEARAGGDIAAYFDAEVELEQLLVAEAIASSSNLRYDDAAEKWTLVAKLNSDLIDALGEAEPATDSQEGPDADRLREWSRQARGMMLMAAGQASFTRGQHESLRRNPGAAVAFFEDAERSFREGSESGYEIGTFMADYSVALKEFASGTEEFVRGDYQAASSSYMRAKVRYDGLLEDADEGAHEFAELPMIGFEAANVAAQFEKASYMAHFSRGEYGPAAENAANLVRLLQTSIDAMPEALPPWQANVVRAQLAWAEADRERATAFVLREEERWDEANRAYAQARKKLEQAAGHMLRSGIPDAVAAQESLMSLASVTIAAEVRQCRAEEHLKREINQLRGERDQLIEKLSAVGVTVNNIQEATAVAEQNTQITLRLEQTVRDTLPDLRAAIEKAALGAEGEQLKAETAELEASDEHAALFLDRVRSFTQRVAAVVSNVGDAAAPIVPVLKVLAPLVGLLL